MSFKNTVATKVLKVVKGKSYINNPQAYWDKRGLTYYRDTQGIGLWKKEALLHQIALLAPETVLEVGCGYGRILQSVEKFHGIKRSAGADFSQSMLNEARKHCKSELILADVTKGLPFKDEEFDLVYTFGVIMHIPPQRHSLAILEISRVAKYVIVHYELPVKNGWHCYNYDNAEMYRNLGLRVQKHDNILVVLK